MPPELITLSGITDEAAPGLDGQLTAVRALGWPAVELRTVGGMGIAALDERAFDRLAGTLAAAGLAVSCVDSGIANWARPITAPFETDLRELTVLARRCAVLGTPYVRVMSYPNAGLAEDEWRDRVLTRMTALAARARDAGLVLLHENCAGWAADRADRMRTLVTETGGDGLRLLFDIGNGVAHGYEAYDLLADVVDLVAHVHVKDAAGTAAEPVYTMPGEGRSRVTDCVRLLLDHGYTGTFSIEPHLRTRPHEGRTAGDDGVELFVSYGRRLERLIDGLVRPTVPGGA